MNEISKVLSIQIAGGAVVYDESFVVLSAYRICRGLCVAIKGLKGIALLQIGK